MEIVIHGTKQGHKTNFILNEEPTFALPDIRNGAKIDDDYPIGNSLFSLSFLNKGCVFSKYGIVRDTLRSFSIGYFAISIYLPANKELKGKGNDIKLLLDELYVNYYSNYIKNNNINRDESYLIHEDWNFIQNVTNKYTEIEKNKRTIEIETGALHPAIHYYDSDEDLLAHFDQPYQEEYNGYSQILFINSNLKGESNPIRILKNSGVEVNPDLKNEYYYLNNFNSSKGIRVTANGRTRSEKKGENQIRAKEQVVIEYSKDDRCFEPIYEVGKIADLSSGIYKYIEIKGNNIILRYEIFNNLKPKTADVSIEIKNRDGKKVEHAEIFYSTNYQPEFNSVNNTITFIGEDIIKKWTFYAKKETESLYSSEVVVTPINQNEPIVLTLLKHKKTVFQGELRDGNNIQYFPDVKISIHVKSIYNQKPECEFVEEEINETYKVIASYSNRDVYLQGETLFCPKDCDTVTIALSKTTQPEPRRYALEMGQLGQASADYSNSETGHDITVKTKNSAYGFIGFKLDKNKKHGNYDGTLVAQYEKRKTFFAKTKIFFSKPPVIAASTISIIIIFLSIFFIDKYITNINEQEKINSCRSLKSKIENYIKGDSLILEDLQKYKSQWPEYLEIAESSKKIDSTEFENNWSNIAQLLDKALEKRESINSLNFLYLKYSKLIDHQSNFGIAIAKIDSSNISEVQIEIGDISSKPLSEIAFEINKIITQIESKNKDLPKELIQVETGKLQEKETEVKPQQDKPYTDFDEKIKTKLKSATITKQELEEYSNDASVSSILKRSIRLYQNFWHLVNTSGQPQKGNFDALLENVNKDTVLSSSELKWYLNSICSSSEKFKEYISIRGKATCETLLELKVKNK